MRIWHLSTRRASPPTKAEITSNVWPLRQIGCPFPQAFLLRSAAMFLILALNPDSHTLGVPAISRAKDQGVKSSTKHVP